MNAISNNAENYADMPQQEQEQNSENENAENDAIPF